MELRNVTKYYHGTVPALANASFSVAEGEFVAVIGPSGAGKSTLLRCINRMIELTGGEISFEDVIASKLNKKDLRKLRTKIGMIFQHYNLVDKLTVIENVLHGRLGYKSTLAGILGRYSREEKNQAFRIINLLGLDDQVYQRCDRLSGGQKQRVGIGRALIQNPKLILCDEPIASLDPNAAKIIMDHLQNISTQMGITIIVNLHQVNVALKYAERIIGVNKGKIVFDGSPAELTSERITDIYGSESKDLIDDLGERFASSYFCKTQEPKFDIFCRNGMLTLGAVIITQYDVVKGFTSIVKALNWGIANFYPDAKSLKELPDILHKLWATVLMAIAATTIAAIFAGLLALLGSRTTRINPICSAIVRGIASFLRNFPLVAWAMVLMLAFSQSQFTGYLALICGSLGFLTRAFVETIDEVGNNPVEALLATGASHFHIIFQAVLPSCLPMTISWLLL